MRSAWMIGLVFVLALAPTPVRAQDAESLRRELQDVKNQFESMRAGYQRAIDALEKRIESLETRPAAPATPAPAPVAPAEARPPSEPLATGPPGGGWPSVMDLARPRQPFGLYTQRGSGQLLFDIGVSGDFVGNFTSNGVEKSNTCTFPGGCNRVFPRTAEIDLFGQIDPYARAMVIFSAGEEFSGSGDFNVQLEEAYFSLLTLPFGSQAKMGKMLVRFGLLNPVHEHDQPQTDRPDVLTQFFGQEALNESGGELAWVAPLPFFLEAVAGIFNGQNETAFGSNSFRLPLVTARLRTFFDLADLGAVQLGASAAFGYTADEARSWIWGADVKYKLTPESWQWPLLTVAAEALVSAEPVQRHGFYAYAEVQPWRRWLGGVRYDWTQYLSADGHQWGVEPYLAFSPSEFLRFRLGYKYTDRGSVRVALNPNGYPRIANEVFLQATFFLGAHQTHGF